jgi:cytochrome c
MRWKLSAVIAGVFVAVAMAESSGNVKQGREAFEKRCTGCHGLDNVKMGPPLRHVFSQRSGDDPKFPYSDALKKARITWDASNLDRWLTNPDAVVPDNDMTFRLNSAEERAAIIAYLKELSGK